MQERSLRQAKAGKPAQYFRAGAGAVLINDRGLVLALERADMPGAWQLPQGGLKQGESPLQAVFREILEETGIPESDLDLLAASPEPLVYELPQGLRNERTGLGQVLYWFLFRLLDTGRFAQITPGDEFRAWEWMPFGHLVERTAEFRKPVYGRLGIWWDRYLG